MAVNLFFFAVCLVSGLIAVKQGRRAVGVMSLGGALLGAGLIVLDGHWDAALQRGVRELLGLAAEACGIVLYMLGARRAAFPSERGGR